MNKHICILTSAHPLDDVRVNSKIAASFISHGFKVSWVGPEISYYAKLPERPFDISYHLTPAFRNRLDRLTSARRTARKAREVSNVDWYYSPDPDAARAATKLARGTEAKVLFDIHELFHGAVIDRWLWGRRASLVRTLVRRRVARTTARSDLVIGVCRSVLLPYAKPSTPQLVVRNCAPLWFADQLEPQAPPLPAPEAGDARTVFMHGKALPNNGCRVVLEALARLPQPTRARVVLFPKTASAAQPYMPDLAARIEDLGVGDAVWLHEAVRHDQMPGLMARCDVGMVAYGRDLGEASLPNRLFEYMASGLAILAPVYSVEIKRIVETEGIGLTVDFEEPGDVAAAIRWFIEHPAETKIMGAKARIAFLERHNWNIEFQSLIVAMATEST